MRGKNFANSNSRYAQWRASCLSVFFFCVMCVIGVNVSAQDGGVAAATEKVWDAAGEIESGNFTRAEQLLDEAEKTEGLGSNIQELIVQLRAKLPEETESSTSVTELDPAGMTSDELQEYLNELSSALEALFKD